MSDVVGECVVTENHWVSITGNQCYNYWIVLGNLMYCLAFVALMDFLIGSRLHKKARWFGVHAISNLIVVVYGWEDVVAVIYDPYKAIDNTVVISLMPFYIIGATHLYHMIAFPDLTTSDLIHHIVFVGIICPAGVMSNFGHNTNVVGFFLSGFPGGLSYVLLVLYYQGWVSRITEKKWNSRYVLK
eukprot:TRINITY_DN7152_c0_g1_i2.p1 TRINITY_DN7152_c0_g1~~TRINITY_DN7152_c0_g1_i2.p1  ORF type:complete len:207 (-),score=32.16 TRINITY_DN7152_c0_g1_i2:256-813(-)